MDRRISVCNNSHFEHPIWAIWMMRDSLMTGKSLVASFFRCLPSQPAVIAADWVDEIFRNWYFTCTLSIRTVVPLVFYQIRMKSHQRQIMNILWVWNIFTSSSRSSNAYKNENWKIQNWDWNINVEWDKKQLISSQNVEN